MSREGGPASMAPESEARLRSHIAAILDVAAVPSDVRNDVAEELYGHLVERVRSHLVAGIGEAAAVDRAIADLGGVDMLGRDFGRTYHSRLWASTVGILLPAVAPRDGRPAAVGWLRFTLGVVVVLSVVGLAVMLPQATPVRGLATLAVDAVAIWAMALAFLALERGQRWALWYALAISVELLLWGIGTVLAAAPGSASIPLGAILAGLVLFEVFVDRYRLRAFIADSRPVGRAMTAVLALSILLPVAVPPALAALPDPSQAGAADLTLTVSMRCDRGTQLFSDTSRTNVSRVQLIAEMTWRRADILPEGVAGLFHPTDYGDSAGFRLLDADPTALLPAWLLVTGDVPVIDVATGETAGWFGSTAPSVGLLPNTIGSFTIGIGLSAIRAGHTIRAAWVLSPTADVGAPWPRIKIAYAHLDRFLLEGTVGCGQTVTAHQVPIPAPAPPQSLTDPFGIGYP